MTTHSSILTWEIYGQRSLVGDSPWGHKIDRTQQLNINKLFFSHGQPQITTIYRALGPSLVAQMVKNLPAIQETLFNSWVGKIPWRRDRLPTPVFLGFLASSDGKESGCSGGDLGWIPRLGRSPRATHCSLLA